MEVTLRIPDDVAMELSANGADVSRQALEALALQFYRDEKIGLYHISEMLGFSRIEAEDFLGRNRVPLCDLSVADLDRDLEALQNAKARQPR